MGHAVLVPSAPRDGIHAHTSAKHSCDTLPAAGQRRPPREGNRASGPAGRTWGGGRDKLRLLVPPPGKLEVQEAEEIQQHLEHQPELFQQHILPRLVLPGLQALNHIKARNQLQHADQLQDPHRQRRDCFLTAHAHESQQETVSKQRNTWPARTAGLRCMLRKKFMKESRKGPLPCIRAEMATKE